MSGKRTLIRNSVHFQVKKEWVEGGMDGPFKVFSVITRRWEWSVEEDFVNEKWWLTFIRRIFQRIRIIRGCREKGGGGGGGKEVFRRDWTGSWFRGFYFIREITFVALGSTMRICKLVKSRRELLPLCSVKCLSDSLVLGSGCFCWVCQHCCVFFIFSYFYL